MVFSRKTISILIAASTALTAVGCSETVLISNPGTVPPTRVNAIIEVETDHPTDPHTLDFGEVYAGETREKEFTIRNVGDDTLQVQDLELSNNASFEITNQGEYAQLLAPNASTIVTVAYNPVQDEHIEGTLLVASNDRDNPQVPVRLLAEGLAPAVDVSPPSYDFGNLELGCVNQVEITISNVGRAPLDIFAIYFEDLADTGELTLANGNPQVDGDSDGDGEDDIDFTLNPSESTTVTIHYTPINVEPDSGILSVFTNTPAEPDEGTTAQQFGIAHLGSTNIDEYLQEGNNSTDILFTVDNSCSMSDEQSALAVNFASFLQIVDALDIDYHLGVATTDIGDGGQLQGSVPIITPSTPDPGGTFSANVNLGINGSGIEQGFHNAWQALEAAVNNVGVNGGFLRDEAGLRLIMVSDEQEQSSSVMGWSPVDYIGYYQSLKANPEHLVVSDITGGMTGCSGAGGSASSGSDYVTGTNMTGGISASICDPNWVSTLSALGWLSQSFADTFELSQTPVEDTIEVRLNDVPVFVGWVYDSALNAIVFDVDHVPENGDGLEIEYTVLGDCSD
ncbi:MAG: choice-of-anchor D domain-containing protein [Proteobacteria bacterium]|nr:choice-of-anchor D domain-containing protein [Pseudomonadota bacterium]